MNPAVQEESQPLADSAVLTIEQGLPLPSVLVTTFSICPRGLMGRHGFPRGWAEMPPAVLSFLCPPPLAVGARARCREGSFFCVRPLYSALHQSPLHSAQGCASRVCLFSPAKWASAPTAGHLGKTVSQHPVILPQAPDRLLTVTPLSCGLVIATC